MRPFVLRACLVFAAIDIWSAGVMLCSLLCRRYPLFYTAHKLDAHVMAQVMLLLGAEAVERAAVACGTLACWPARPRVAARG